MATFTQRNFPHAFGNDQFVGAGERTCYVPQSPSFSAYESGFPLAVDTVLFGSSYRELKAGTNIWFTYPPKLHPGSDLDLPRGIYALCSLRSFSANPDGYVRISTVTKPSPTKTGRVKHGETTQSLVASRVKEISDEMGINYSLVSIAKVGSQAPDLVADLDSKRHQFEIKGTSSSTAPITLFDKSARRERYPQFLDYLAECYIEGIDYLKEDMQKLKMPMSFLGIIDYYKHRYSFVGFAGDDGVCKSGKLPPDLKTDDSFITAKVDEFIIEHFHESGDNYFTVHDRSKDEFKFFHTGYKENVIGADELPPIKRVELATYGGPSGGGTRIGLRIKL